MVESNVVKTGTRVTNGYGLLISSSTQCSACPFEICVSYRKVKIDKKGFRRNAGW